MLGVNGFATAQSLTTGLVVGSLNWQLSLDLRSPVW